jgi:hypothetical protein
LDINILILDIDIFKYLLLIYRVMAVRKKILICISPETDGKLRELIVKKHGRYERGLLSREVEEALVNWILLHRGEREIFKGNSQSQQVNPPNKIHRVWQEVKDYLLKKYYQDLSPTQTIAEKHLVEAIKAVRGSDPKTVRKHLRNFQEFKLIKHISGAIWEVLL